MGETRILKGLNQYLLPFGTTAPARLTLILLLSNLYFYLPFYALYLQGKGLDLVQISELSIILLLSNLIFEIPGGVLADHFSKKQILLLGFLLQLIGEIVFLQGNQFFHFAIASLIGGIHWALHSGCLEAYLHELLRSQKEPERYSEALGYIGFAKSTANFIAFLGGTLIVWIWEKDSFFLLIFLTVCGVALALCGMFNLPSSTKNQMQVHSEIEPQPLNLSWLDRLGLSEVRALAGTLGILILFFWITQPFADSLLILIQPFYEQKGGVIAFLGVLIAAGMAIEGFVLKQVHIFQKEFGIKKVLAVVCLFLGSGFCLLSLSPNIWLTAFFFLWIRSAVGIQQVLLTDQTLKLFPVHRHATVLSLINLGSRLYISGGMWGIAFVAEFSIGWAFQFLAGLMLIATVLVSVIPLPEPAVNMR